MASADDLPRTIAHVTDCYRPRVGGIELQVQGLAEAQAHAGHEPHVITTTLGSDDAHVHRVPAPYYLRPLSYELPVFPQARRHIATIFERIRPDVVHIHIGGFAPFAWSAARCAADADLPLVVSVHSVWGAAARGTYRALARTLRCTEWPMVVSPVSKVVEDGVRQVSRDHLTVVVVPNGLDVGAWRRPPRPSSTERLRLVAVGRLAPRKRTLALLRILRAAESALGQPPRLKATIIGDGPLGAQARQYIAENGMASWVNLAGPVDRGQLPSLLAAAHAFIAPATREAFGLAALEARAAGLPIIARRGTGVAEFVTDGRNGVLAADDGEMVAAIVRLATDQELRRRLAAESAARPPVTSDWPQVVALFEGCYTDAAALIGADAAGPEARRA